MGRYSPGHIDRVAPNPPAPRGEWLGDARYRCTAGLGLRAIIDAFVLRLQKTVYQETRPLKDH